MTNLHYDGFDLGDIGLHDEYLFSAPGQTVAVATTPYGVGRAIQVNSGYLGKSIPATSEVFMGAYLYCYGGGTSANGFIQVAGDNGTIPHISIGSTATTIFARLGDYTGTALGTAGSWAFPTTTWKHVQVYVKVADSGGRVIIKIDDLTVFDYTGDTRNGGTSATVDQVRIGRPDNAGAFYWDDYWINDAAGAAPHNTFYGIARCRMQSPNAAGASTGFTPSTGANYTCVDEQPYAAADYVSNPGAISGTRDTYAAADISTGNEVLAVKSAVIAKKSGPGLLSLKPVIRSGGTNYSASPVLLAAADRALSGVWYTDPATGVAWTPAGVNAAEVGFEVA